MLLYVYRLRYQGRRQARSAMAMEGAQGDLQLLSHAAGWRGRQSLIAYLHEPGSANEILPKLTDVRVLRIREALLLAGIEQVPRGRKSVERYAQTWVCTVTPIALERWPMRLANQPSVSGFAPEDDDCPE
jgi:hypothetical protein